MFNFERYESELHFIIFIENVSNMLLNFMFIFEVFHGIRTHAILGLYSTLEEFGIFN